MSDAVDHCEQVLSCKSITKVLCDNVTCEINHILFALIAPLLIMSVHSVREATKTKGEDCALYKLIPATFLQNVVSDQFLVDFEIVFPANFFGNCH